MDYFTDPNFSLSVREFFDRIAGNGSFEHLEMKVKSPLWVERWEHSEKSQETDNSRVSPFIEEAQKSAKDWLPKLKKDILEYGKSGGYLPNDFDMNILLLPPKSGDKWSYWNSKTRVLSMGSCGFDFFPKNEKVIAVPAKAYNIAFHEILGHAAHQIHSENLPCSLRFTEEIGMITPTKSTTEGVAIDREKQGYTFLRGKLKELDLTEEDVVLLQDKNYLQHQSRCELMHYALTKDRELREKGFDGYEYLLGLTKNPVMARVFKYDFNEGFFDVWKWIGHTLGPIHYEGMVNKTKKEFGEDYLEKEKKDFHKATLKGVWSWEVYPDAVAYFLRNKEKRI